MAATQLRILGLLVSFGILLSVQVRGDADAALEKRAVPVKRYVASLAKSGELSSFTRPAWNKKLQSYDDESSDDNDQQKRYVGALAKAGDLKSRFREAKRDDIENFTEQLLTAEELRRLRREILREELLQEERDEEEALDEEKRSLASLARSGSMPFAGEGKRGIANLAKNGDFPWSGKRGGIASLMRSRLDQLKRNRDEDYDLDNFLDELANEEDDAPYRTVDKRNLASFARSGGLSGLSYRNEKKDAYEDWGGADYENKRNVQSLARNRMSPLVEGKRYVGAFLASNGRPPYLSRDPEFKRNHGTGWAWGYRRPEYTTAQSLRRGPEADSTDEVLAKRYVAALLRQGRLPVGIDSSAEQVDQDDNEHNEDEEEAEQAEELNKRHIGSLAAHKSFAMRKKKSVDLKEQAQEQLNSQADKKVDTGSNRSKRDVASSLSSDEYTMPVLQNTVNSDYEDIVSKATGDGPSARNKRYFAVRGGGKIPGGRLPQIGSSRRSHNQNSGRRRGH
uniref:Neuropeptide-like 1 n=1 Tax=Nilaparvata lugens TaxID=108931 RepID=U3U446_NILLU|nr:neuropeptide-like precursor 1 [Nilaparvata lugens]